MVLKLVEIRGVGASTAKTLAGHGIKSVSDVAKADVDRITGIPGFGELRAKDVIAAAAALLAAMPGLSKTGKDRSENPSAKKKKKVKKDKDKKTKNNKKSKSKKGKKKSKKKNNKKGK